MNITQKITLDLTKRSVFQYVCAKQGDNSSRSVKITLTNDGEVYHVPKGASANFRAEKPDGTMILNPAVVNDDGTVTIELTQQTLAVRGDVIADVYLTDDSGAILSSVSFVIRVDSVPVGKHIDSISETLIFMHYVEQAERAAAQSRQFANQAAQNAEKAEQAASKASDKAPINHAAPDTTYGVGNAANYGHVRLSDHVDSFNNETMGIAATPKAVMDSVNAETVNRKKEIAVERKRIDSFAALPPGETAGNAELLDIRIGNNGHKYATAGEAVRRQIETVGDAVESMEHSLSNSVYDYQEVEADEVASGSKSFGSSPVYEDSTSCYTKTIIPYGVKKIKVTGKSADSTYDYTLGAFYNDQNNVISKFGDGKYTSYTDLEVTVPDDASYVVVNQHGTLSTAYNRVKFLVPQPVIKKLNEMQCTLSDNIYVYDYQEVDANEVTSGSKDFGNQSVYKDDGSCFTKTFIPSGVKRIKVTGKSASAIYNYNLGAFYNAENKVIGKFGDGEYTSYTDFEVDVPDNASYVIVNQQGTLRGKYNKIKLLVTTRVKEKTKDIDRKVNALEDKVMNDLRFECGAYVKETGVLSQDQNGQNTGYVRTDRMREIFVTAYGSATWIYPIAFYDEEKNFLKEYSIVMQETNTYHAVVPPKAKYVIASSYGIGESTKPRAYFKTTGADETLDEKIAKLQEGKYDPLSGVEFSVFAKWGLIGDSLTVGNTTEASGTVHNRNLYYSWGQYLARKMGNICLNFGKSGITSKGWMTDSVCYQRLINENNLCQCYCIALGANDASSANIEKVPIGSIADVHFENMETNADTVYGWYSRVINAVNTTAPKARVFLFTLPYPRNQDQNVQSINNMIRELSKNPGFKHTYLVDLDVKYNDFYATGKLKDEIRNTGWHLTSLGYLYASRVNELALSQTIQENSEDFQDVPFIPYGSTESLD